MTQSEQLQAANEAIKNGIEAVSAGQLEEARRCFEQSMVHAPDNHIALKNLATIAAQQGQLAQAEAHFMCVSPSDETPAMLFDLARICDAQGKLPAARDTCEKALRKDVAHLEIKRYLAGLEQRLGNREVATCLYRDLADDHPADKKSVMTYTKRIWTEHPDDASVRLTNLLNGLTDPKQKREVLFELILIKEIAGRGASGRAKYHAATLDDAKIQYSLPELSDLEHLCKGSLDENPKDAGALLGYACALIAGGEWDRSQSYFQQLHPLLPGHIGSVVQLDDRFLETLATTADDQLVTELPDLIHSQPRSFGDQPVFMVASDFRYFHHFSRPLVLSLARHKPGVCIHLHIMDASANQLDEAKGWSDSLSNMQCAISAETTGLASGPPGKAASYYHSVRFVRFFQLRGLYAGPLWMVDADALANCDPTSLLRTSGNWDVAFRLRPGRLEPWNMVSAGLVGMAPTEEAFQFYRLVAAYITHFLKQDRLAWGIDQVALLAALYRMNKKRLRLLTELEQDIDLQTDGVFWFLSGANKALFPELASDSDATMAKLTNREQRFAQAYLDYAP
jgi:tetratricopeptide (TPR) repeat protein